MLLKMDVWDSDDICYAAIKNGHLDCLQYAHENGGRLYREIVARYKKKINNDNNEKELECLEYVHECE